VSKAPGHINADVFKALDDPNAGREELYRAWDAMAEKDAQLLRREEAIQELAPRLAAHLQKVWRQVLHRHGSATYYAAVSMAVRDNMNEEGLLCPDDYYRVVCGITDVLYGLEPPPEDDYDGVRFEARPVHMEEFSTEPGTAQGPDVSEESPEGGDSSAESPGEGSDEDDDISEEASEEEDSSEAAKVSALYWSTEAIRMRIHQYYESAGVSGEQEEATRVMINASASPEGDLSGALTGPSGKEDGKLKEEEEDHEGKSSSTRWMASGAAPTW